MKEHSNQLDRQDKGKEDHEQESDGFELQVSVGDVDVAVLLVETDLGTTSCNWPLDIQGVLVLLEQINRDHPDAVQHQETEHHRVPQLFETLCDLLLLLLVLL